MQLTHSRGILFILSFLILSGSPSIVHAQISDSARVSVLTIYPGEAIYALWGHSALRIWDPTTKFDVSYNYGTFDFRSPLSFMARFAYGKLDYQLSLNSSQALLGHSWLSEERGVVEQELNMTREEIRTLYAYLSRNALPENRVYRYDFLYENCATRILDALEHALQTPVADFSSTGVSFRSLIRPYLRRHAELDLAINLAMGSPVDRIASHRQLSFLPVEFQILLQDAHTLAGEPLVMRADTLFGTPTSPQPRRTISLPTGIGWGIFLFAFLLFLRDFRTPRRRVFDITLFGFVSLLGLVISFFWFISLHEITRPNLHLMWAWPMHIIPIFFLGQSWTVIYWWAAMVSAGVFALGTAWWGQSLPAATLPLALATSVRCFILARSTAYGI